MTVKSLAGLIFLLLCVPALAQKQTKEEKQQAKIEAERKKNEPTPDIEVKYDKFKNETTISPRDLWLTGSYSSGLMLKAVAIHEGEKRADAHN